MVPGARVGTAYPRKEETQVRVQLLQIRIAERDDLREETVQIPSVKIRKRIKILNGQNH